MSNTPQTKRIVFLDRAGLPERFVATPPEPAHEWVDYSSTSPDLINERALGADVLITNKVKIGEATLVACPTVKHIAVAATGFNVVDIEACERHGVSVSNIPNYAATTVAEHVITSALCLRRELLKYREKVISGAWQQSETFCLFDKPLNDLAGATFGVIGYGEIGRATAAKAHALGMKVVFSSRSVKQSDFATQLSLDELITRADIISLHCSLTPETENLIGAAELDKMQSHAILINTARGGVANEGDIVNAIQKNQIGGIAFDVLVEEPPKTDSKLLSIAKRSNVIITPHIAWASEQAMQHLVNILASNVNAFLLGQTQNLVTKIQS